MVAADVATLISEFVADSNVATITLPYMTSGQRKSAKKLLEKYPELRYKNEGQGSQRHLYVFKVLAATDEDYSRDFLQGWEKTLDIFDEPAATSDAYSKDFLLKFRNVATIPDARESTLRALSENACDLSIPESKLIDASADTATQNPMDGLLLNSFLQAAKTNQITKQLRLGMPSKGSRIYIECIKPCRPVGISIDVKLSSYVCLKTFFEHLEARGLLELKHASPDPVVASFCWDHPEIINFTPWPVSKTALGVLNGSAAPPSRSKPAPICTSSKEDISPSETPLDVIQRIPSPSKARARARR